MADDKQQISKKTTQASAKHYWGKNAHLANGGNGSSNKKSNSTGKKVATGIGLGIATAAVSKGVKKSIKKTNSKTIIAFFISLILALALGVGACFIMSRNDEFTLLGDEVIYMTSTETYKDNGVKIVEFGIDLSKKAEIKTNLKINDQGEFYADESMLENPPNQFYICYTVKSIKFGFVYGVQKIRFVTFTDLSEGGE